jgi:hypothetical protein
MLELNLSESHTFSSLLNQEKNNAKKNCLHQA